ncbi:hypothetical protein PanWU01x14_321540 [Parasponia andersonii]|uniref:Uncharacterized protein n=1 Tax=Parasponia andersonii TaxID=3476 RepID=A0A2P5AL79_PARAD|nr:hypothetical protein PanWU01x14_321540 [Parasponia andersonii]
MTTWYQSFGCSSYLGGPIVYMKTMVVTPNLVKVGASEHGRDEGKKGATRGKSRDVVTSLETKVSRLESNLGTLGERVDDLDGHCDGLET